MLPHDLATFPGSPFAWRWRYLDEHPGPHARHARFFCALDECSSREALRAHPALAHEDAERRIAELFSTVGLLLARLDARASGAAAPGLGTPPPPVQVSESEPARACRAAVRTWSRVQRELLLEHYGTGGADVDREAVAEGFLAFASGALRIPVVGRRGVGEPDGAHYFAFAEFALLAAELDVDRGCWERVLAPLVWTQEVFAHMQRPPGAGPHRFHEFAPRGRERRFDPALAERARDRARALTTRQALEALHGAHCRETFGDRQPALDRRLGVSSRSGTPSATA